LALIRSPTRFDSYISNRVVSTRIVNDPHEKDGPSFLVFDQEEERSIDNHLKRWRRIHLDSHRDGYQRLTRQLSFDQVRVFRSPQTPKRRELRVAASWAPNQVFPPNVLNGQASKALQLVPYFVFSRFQPDIMELDLLLIDDPSESGENLPPSTGAGQFSPSMQS